MFHYFCLFVCTLVINPDSIFALLSSVYYTHTCISHHNIIHVGWSDCTNDCITEWTCCGIGHITKTWSKCGLQEGGTYITSLYSEREGGSLRSLLC